MPQCNSSFKNPFLGHLQQQYIKYFNQYIELLEFKEGKKAAQDDIEFKHWRHLGYSIKKSRTQHSTVSNDFCKRKPRQFIA
jgi:hypothetical protein